MQMENILKENRWSGPITIPTEAKSFSIGSDGVVSYVDNAGELQTSRTNKYCKIS